MQILQVDIVAWGTTKQHSYISAEIKKKILNIYNKQYTIILKASFITKIEENHIIASICA